MIESHLSETSGLSGKRTRAARLVDRDANDCAIPPPPATVINNDLEIRKWCDQWLVCINDSKTVSMLLSSKYQPYSPIIPWSVSFVNLLQFTSILVCMKTKVFHGVIRIHPTEYQGGH